MSAKITPRNAANVLFHVGHEGGYPGSGFIVELLRCIERADATNLTRLGLGFPGLVAAWRLLNDLQGVQRLQSIANSEDGHDEPFGEELEGFDYVEYGTRWTGYEGGLAGAPLNTMTSRDLNHRHAADHAAEIRGWQAEVGITPDAEPVYRTVTCAATPWRADTPQGGAR